MQTAWVNLLKTSTVIRKRYLEALKCDVSVKQHGIGRGECGSMSIAHDTTV